MSSKESNVSSSDDDIDYEGWNNATTFQDIIQLYMDHLDGKIAAVPTYAGKLLPDTIRQLRSIRKINEMGVLTTDSQNGLDEKKNGERTKQRAYINAYCRFSMFTKIARYLSAQNGIVFFGFKLKEEWFTCGYDASDCPTFSYPVTTKTRNDELYPKSCTNCWFHADPGEFEFILDEMCYFEADDEKFEQFFNEDNPICQFYCIDTVWGRPDYLAEQLIKAIEFAKSEKSEI